MGLMERGRERWGGSWMEMTSASRKEDTMPWKGKVGDEGYCRNPSDLESSRSLDIYQPCKLSTQIDCQRQRSSMLTLHGAAFVCLWGSTSFSAVSLLDYKSHPIDWWRRSRDLDQSTQIRRTCNA